MELTKHGHACVTLERDGRRLVIDPGGLTPEDALAGADAALITHEHVDHFSAQRLAAALAANPALQVWTNASVAAAFDGDPARVHVVGEGDAFTANGFEVRVYGRWHAELHPDIPRVANVGFLVDGAVFHPGDALTVPDAPVRTLLLPVHGPWSRVADLIDWVREVRPERALAVHDGALNQVGVSMVGAFLGPQGPAPTGVPYTRLAPGESHRLT
ncbi:MBL fold metallo-hydrolase [Actinoplanes teichomyceticus]|uniref:L-ascorbate metabolism protein UlaG (Beta-lactamase superfamily) n=1 Tax=Actinoplanes teichomyceticus TaxID=1867 RepID=A0A561WQC6_ACTTI|nr:MBL fold metallo-hydrolase [Actinoplanes teichomyceticus]TWG26071.1 L-ascorbate metabolism protein UlaG (beta-lactamase superfamily) [Actinoplanes teichomyceticus]GIF11145.1 MBL fold metallo-hydrolase [Actinoplanes teichomyceticus]